MPTISELKELSTTETPLFLVTCELPDGGIERWSTHRVRVNGETFEARILGHNLFEIRSDADEGVDSVSQVSLTLANADSHFSQIERGIGWKGSKVSVQFLFYDLRQDIAVSETRAVFRGVANAPDEITESSLRLTLSNRLNFQRLLLPQVRIQRRCPWKFPATPEQRQEARNGAAEGRYSPFFRCGYSAEVTGGTGNLNGGLPYASCDYTREQCEQRGMFDLDEQGRSTGRFGGFEFVPSTTLVRSFGDKAYHASPVVENEARYNDFVPLVYGTAWYAPPVVFARNDGNLTRMEVLIGMGEIEGVLKVLVNDVEIPTGRAGTNMTATGWYNIISHGGRGGAFNDDFLDANGKPAGDPYGSMAFLSLVAPSRIHDGRTLPRVGVLLHGIKLSRFDPQGGYLGEEFDNNPAWVILDILRRSGWSSDEIDLASFGAAAAYCAELIAAVDLYGNPVQMPRFQCNLVVRKRRSAAELIRGIKNASRLSLGQGDDGRLRLQVEDSLARQQPTKPQGSNSPEPLNGGWPSYEFGDGTLCSAGILRRENGEPAIRFWSRSTVETPNRYSVEFQDAFNEYQQDSLSLVDIDDTLRTGQEISVPLNALGISNFHQAARVIRLHLDKSIRGGTYAEFTTSVRGAGLRPGDLIALTYLKEGFQRQPFRIKSIAPGLNYRTARITAQIHSDAWYTDWVDGVGSTGSRRQPGFEIGLPRPLIGKIFDEDGEPQFEVTERIENTGDGQVKVWLSVGFIAPAQPVCWDGRIPIVSLSPVISDAGGTLKGGQALYYAVSAIGADGGESALSFLVRATIPPGASTHSVRLVSLSFAPETTAFNVYRGKTPTHLYRIATHNSVAEGFTDTGLPIQLLTAPDENYDHANFRWRLELQPECAVTLQSAVTVGNGALDMPPNGYSGMTARITKGKGSGQERAILTNSTTTLTVDKAWETELDASSTFVVAEAGWHSGATSRTSPVEFEVPNRVGATVHISGRSANVNDTECAFELSPLTRWRIGSAAGGLDAGVPPKPVFGLYEAGQGTVELLGAGFANLDNTRTVSAGTLTLHYWPELAGPPNYALAAAAGMADTFLDLSSAGGIESGNLLQLGDEVLHVTSVDEAGHRCEVLRGSAGTTPAAHAAGTLVYRLSKRVFIVPFARDFFGSPASGQFSYPIFIPDVRIAAAELIMTNIRGNSEPSLLAFTSTLDSGLRTLSGGQLSIQVEGYLAIQPDVAPPLLVDEPHSVRDIYAVVREAPSGSPIVLRLKQNAESYCTLTIAPGSTISEVMHGFGLPQLAAEAQLSLDILSVGDSASGSPGRDLTVTIRL